MAELGRRVKQVLTERGISQSELARMIGVKQQTISYICSSEHPATTSRYTTRIAEALGVNPAWLASGSGTPTDPTVPIRVQGITVRAIQVPVIRKEDIRAFIDGGAPAFHSALVTDKGLPGKTFAVEVSSESMATKFRPEDIVVIDTSLTPEPGDYVVAMLTTGEVVFRRYRSRAPTFELVPENPDFDSTAGSEVERVAGVMVEHRSYRRRR